MVWLQMTIVLCATANAIHSCGGYRKYSVCGQATNNGALNSFLSDAQIFGTLFHISRRLVRLS